MIEQKVNINIINVATSKFHRRKHANEKQIIDITGAEKRETFFLYGTAECDINNFGRKM